MSIYTRLNRTALRLLKKYGFLANFTRISRGTYDPATGGSSDSSTTYTAYVVRDKFDKSERSDSAIQDGDIKLIAQSGNYQIDDTVAIDGDSYRVFIAEPIIPASTNCAYILGVRK